MACGSCDDGRCSGMCSGTYVSGMEMRSSYDVGGVAYSTGAREDFGYEGGII